MFRFGRYGLMSALLGALAVDSTAKRQRLDEELAEQRRQIQQERRAAEQAKREAEQRQRRAREERRRLTIQRVFASLQQTLSAYQVPSDIGRPLSLPELVGQDTLNRFAAQVTSIVAREIQRDD